MCQRSVKRRNSIVQNRLSYHEIWSKSHWTKSCTTERASISFVAWRKEEEDLKKKNISQKVDDIENRSVNGRSKREIISSKISEQLLYVGGGVINQRTHVRTEIFLVWFELDVDEEEDRYKAWSESNTGVKRWRSSAAALMLECSSS